VQLTYWPLYTAGRFDVASTLVDYVATMLPQLYVNAGAYGGDSAALSVAAPYDGSESGVTVTPQHGGGIVGDLVWTCHNLYLHASHTANDTLLTGLVLPLLRRSVNLYLHIMWRDGDGAIHLPVTDSPEYPYPTPPGPSNDTNYDLALFKWGAVTLAAHLPNDTQAAVWRDVVANLTAFPTDDAGLRVAAGVPFTIPHRHFSHLFAVYPLHLVTYEDADGGDAASRALIATSLDHWNGLTCSGVNGSCPNGFTFDGSASISAAMGGDRAAAAAANLTRFMTSGLVRASTMYAEGNQPCIESPLAAANSLQELLLQSWGGRIRVFPAVPPAWPAAVFANLSAAGGFAVTAVRNASVTSWFAISAPFVGGGVAATATVSAPSLAPPYAWSPAGAWVQPLASGDIAVTVPAGGTVTVWSAASPPSSFVVAPVAQPAGSANHFGVH